MTKIYRQTGTIKAEQFTQENEFELTEKYSMELFGYVSIGSGPNIPVDHAGDGCMVYSIDTKRGQIHLVVGDWIATGVNGEHWVIADDVFKKTYAELPVIPKNVAYIIKQAKKGDYKLGWVFYDTYSGIWRVSVGNWIRTHADMFARAWLDGYQVEEDE